MTERKWTPGPWYVSNMSEIFHGDDCNLADCWSVHADIDEDECEANAHLIAAAPDMYDALESAEESIATFIGVHGYPTDSGAGEILRQVSAALAKARGE